MINKDSIEKALYNNLSDKEKEVYNILKENLYKEQTIEEIYDEGFDNGFEKKQNEEYAHSYAKGYVRGYVRGYIGVIIKVTFNCHRAGYSIEEITTFTGLTKEQITHIIETEKEES